MSKTNPKPWVVAVGVALEVGVYVLFFFIALLIVLPLLLGAVQLTFTANEGVSKFAPEQTIGLAILSAVLAGVTRWKLGTDKAEGRATSSNSSDNQSAEGYHRVDRMASATGGLLFFAAFAFSLVALLMPPIDTLNQGHQLATSVWLNTFLEQEVRVVGTLSLIVGAGSLALGIRLGICLMVVRAVRTWWSFPRSRSQQG